MNIIKIISCRNDLKNIDVCVCVYDKGVCLSNGDEQQDFGAGSAAPGLTD